jgi:hypothetical protein
MWGILIFSFGCENDKPGIVESKLKVFDPVPLNKSNAQKIFVHYMTWYETKASSGSNSWGSHWTMANVPQNRSWHFSLPRFRKKFRT